MVETSTASTQDPRVEAIRAFTSAGFALFPCNGKHPRIEAWNAVAPGTYTAQNLPGNYGVVLPADVLVVDIDPRNFAPGDNPVARLKAALGGPLVSFTVKTGGGGYHVYFRKDPEVRVRNGVPEYPGIEFKSFGRFLVGPGSVHPDTGKLYTVAHGTPAELQDAPAALVELVKKTEIPFDEIAGTGAYIDDAATQGRYAAWLQDVAEPSVQGKSGDLNAFKVACMGRDLGLSPAVCFDLMLELWNPRCAPPWDAEELRVKVVNAYSYAQGAVGTKHPEAAFKDAPPLAESQTTPPPKEEELSWNLDANGTVKRTFHNLTNYFKFSKAGLYRLFAYNEFTNRVEFERPAPWHRGIMPAARAVTDADLALLKGHLASRHGFEKSVNEIAEAVSNIAHERRFHPVREYLEGLKWDKQPRLDSWLTDFLGVEASDYARAVGRKTICAAVMRVFKPGIKFDHVLVLDGAEGIGKSTVVEILAGDWHSDSPVDPHSRDTVQAMQGCWFIELAEMEVTNRTEEDALKAFITRRKDRVRLAYNRLDREFPRQSVFIATKNPLADGTYFRDGEGRRRWWPVTCRGVRNLGLGFRQVDFAGLKAVRDQLFAEAVAICKTKGEALDMETAELKAKARAEVERRTAEHPWTERIAGWLRTTKPTAVFLTGREVYVEGQGGLDINYNRAAQTAVAHVMRDLGWAPAITWQEGRSVRGYAPKNAAAAAEADVLEGLL